VEAWDDEGVVVSVILLCAVSLLSAVQWLSISSFPVDRWVSQHVQLTQRWIYRIAWRETERKMMQSALLRLGSRLYWLWGTRGNGWRTINFVRATVRKIVQF
jgi:hypothetical protein